MIAIIIKKDNHYPFSVTVKMTNVKQHIKHWWPYISITLAIHLLLFIPYRSRKPEDAFYQENAKQELVQDSLKSEGEVKATIDAKIRDNEWYLRAFNSNLLQNPLFLYTPHHPDKWPHTWNIEDILPDIPEPMVTPHDSLIYEIKAVIDFSGADLPKQGLARRDIKKETPLFPESKRPVLNMPNEEMTSLLDNMWSMSVNDQWDIIQKYMDVYDKDRGDLYKLVQRFHWENFDIGSLPPNLFDYLETMAHYRPILKDCLEYVKENPRTKVANELWFMIGSICRTYEHIVGMFELVEYSLPPVTEMLRGYHDSRAAFTSFKEQLEKINGVSLSRMYDQHQIKAYSWVDSDAGQRNDALFLIGSLYWMRGDKSHARDAWQKINPNIDLKSSYFTDAYLQLCSSLDNNSKITEVIMGHEMRRVSFLSERWQKFRLRRSVF